MSDKHHHGVLCDIRIHLIVNLIQKKVYSEWTLYVSSKLSKYFSAQVKYKTFNNLMKEITGIFYKYLCVYNLYLKSCSF